MKIDSVLIPHLTLVYKKYQFLYILPKFETDRFRCDVDIHKLIIKELTPTSVVESARWYIGEYLRHFDIIISNRDHLIDA